MFRFHNGRGAAFGGDVGGRKTLTLRPVIRHSPARAFLTNCIILTWRGLLFALRHPIELGVAAAYAYSLIVLGPVVTILIDVGLLIVAVVWWLKWPGSFNQYIDAPLYGWWRHLRRYARKWQSTMKLTRLVAELGDDRYAPAIRKVRGNKFVDHVLVDLVNGISEEDFEDRTTALASAFKAERCRIRLDQPGRVWVDFYHRDALRPTIPALPIPENPDLKALPVGTGEFGDPWLLQLLGAHVFIAGLTGAGKGSVEWSPIRAMCPLIANGTVRLRVVDPKGGMELGIGEPLFYRFATDLDEATELLAEAVDVMQDRARRLRAAGKRLHEPTPDDPFDVVVIDELANLTAYDKSNGPRQNRNKELIQLLLSQGRAPGVSVIAAVQDPRIEVVSFRSLFPIGVALRLRDEQQVKMVLGQGARERGAECDKIGASQQGVGYVQLETVREPMRVRAAYVSDDDIKTMCLYAPGTQAAQLVTPQHEMYVNRDKTVPV